MGPSSPPYFGFDLLLIFLVAVAEEDPNPPPPPPFFLFFLFLAMADLVACSAATEDDVVVDRPVMARVLGDGETKAARCADTGHRDLPSTTATWIRAGR